MKMIKLKTPLTEEEVRKLKVNDKVILSGIIFTARDRAHKYLLEDKSMKKKFENAVIYHCGPVIKNRKVISAGPTSSIRLEKYTHEIIRQYKIKAIIGKGGMGRNTREACKKYGCVYLSAVGGAAAYIAKSIKKIIKGYKLEFEAEAIWELEVENFPVIVTIDSNGNSIHDEILKKSGKTYKEMIK